MSSSQQTKTTPIAIESNVVIAEYCDFPLATMAAVGENMLNQDNTNLYKTQKMTEPKTNERIEIQRAWMERFLTQNEIKHRRDLIRKFSSRDGKRADYSQIYASAKKWNQTILSIPTWKANIRRMFELEIPGYKIHKASAKSDNTDFDLISLDDDFSLDHHA